MCSDMRRRPYGVLLQMGVPVTAQRPEARESFGRCGQARRQARRRARTSPRPLTGLGLAPRRAIVGAAVGGSFTAP